jgi:ferric-chelate reductase (NADPH)
VRIELQADAFKKATWTPGAKARLRTGTFQLRTYTPVAWDAQRGTSELIAFTHGDGPGADWFRRVTAGASVEVLGPQPSIDLRSPAERVVFIGDESSVALAVASQTVTERVTHVFEAIDPAALTGVLNDLGLNERSTVVAKAADRANLLQLARDAAVAEAAPSDLVVSGDAATVHVVRRAARSWPQIARRIKGKAYWAEGRTGLD